MFIDIVKIKLKAGNGGNGAKTFYSSKLVNLGGPDGGDGGKGGDVIFRADGGMSTLLDFKYKSSYLAGDGGKGEQQNRTGKNGADMMIRVPCGTVIKDLEGNIIADLLKEGEEKSVLRGGNGGHGNKYYTTSTRRAPNFSQLGETTEVHSVILELKTIADAGLIGFPSVGKSLILSMISDAHPKVADYHFTTLSPNLGVVRYYDDGFVVADIPGLIEGAAHGAGLGFEFLRHIERVRLLLHVVDIAGSEGRDPYGDYLAVRKELKAYSKVLAKLPEIIVLNKCDLLPWDGDNAQLKGSDQWSVVSGQLKECHSSVSEESQPNKDKADNCQLSTVHAQLSTWQTHPAVLAFLAKLKKKTAVLCPISAATGAGIKPMLDAVYKKLKALRKKPAPEFSESAVLERPKEDTFEIKREDGMFKVTGGAAEKLARTVVINDPESFAWFQQALNKRGVMDELKRQGLQNGDTVKILDIEFDYVE
ncbi:hypothetical protein FACS1894211_12320 [Clostridia bacterium]|nr:hypothetical protein FACS1894211_12320 [Clostridia bacterium]